jgi:hypothetical protein
MLRAGERAAFIAVCHGVAEAVLNVTRFEGTASAK